MGAHKMARPGPAERLAILKRRRDVALRHLKGETQWQIAEAVGIDQGNVSRDLAWVHALWLEESKLAHGERVARELARIDETERQAWQAWQRSQQIAETTRTRKTLPGERLTAEVQRQDQVGDPHFLEIILKCSERRSKLLGLEKALPPALVLPIPWDQIVVPPDRDEVEARLAAAIARQAPALGDGSGPPSSNGHP
jgi:hypothetical protein